MPEYLPEGSRAFSTDVHLRWLHVWPTFSNWAIPPVFWGMLGSRGKNQQRTKCKKQITVLIQLCKILTFWLNVAAITLLSFNMFFEDEQDPLLLLLPMASLQQPCCARKYGLLAEEQLFGTCDGLKHEADVL